MRVAPKQIIHTKSPVRLRKSVPSSSRRQYRTRKYMWKRKSSEKSPKNRKFVIIRQNCGGGWRLAGWGGGNGGRCDGGPRVVADAAAAAAAAATRPHLALVHDQPEIEVEREGRDHVQRAGGRRDERGGEVDPAHDRNLIVPEVRRWGHVGVGGGGGGGRVDRGFGRGMERRRLASAVAPMEGGAGGDRGTLPLPGVGLIHRAGCLIRCGQPRSKPEGTSAAATSELFGGTTQTSRLRTAPAAPPRASGCVRATTSEKQSKGKSLP